MTAKTVRSAARPRRLRLMCGAGVASLISGALAHAGPTALPGVVSGIKSSGGTPSFGSISGSTQTVTLNASRTLIDWSSFGLGQGQTLNFQFGSGGASSIVLNRITTGAISINGTINGYAGSALGGNVWIVSPGGLVLGPHAAVSAGSLLLTTSNFSDDASFLKDSNFKFSFVAPASETTLEVQGGAQLNAAGGSLALIAPRVKLDAHATVAGAGASSVLYGAADGYTVTFVDAGSQNSGLALFSFAVDAPTNLTTPLMLAGQTQAGAIYAAGMEKAGVIDDLITVSGQMIATSASADGGAIVLNAGGGLASSGSGPLQADATGGAAGIKSAGGAFQAPSVTFTAGGAISADAASSFSQVKSFALQGAGVSLATNLQTAGTTTLDAGSGTLTLQKVDTGDHALTLGGGGFALNGAVSSGSAATTFATSGVLSLGGTGDSATLLDSNLAKVTASGVTLSGGTGVKVLAPTVSAAQVTLQALQGDIDFASKSAATFRQGLAVDAQHGALTQSGSGGLVVSGGALTGLAGSVALTAADNHVATLGAFTTSGDLKLQTADGLSIGGPLTTGGSGDIQLTSGAALQLGTAQVSAAGHTVSLATVGPLSKPDITQSGGGVVTAATLSASSAGALDLEGTSNAIGTLGKITAGGDLAVVDGQALTVAGPLSTSGAGDIALTAAGDLALGSASVNAGGRQVVLTTAKGGDITQAAAGVITAGTLTVSSAGGALLTGANLVSTLGSVSSAGDVALTNDQDLTVAGPISTPAGARVSLAALQGDLTTSGALHALGDLNLSAPSGTVDAVGALQVDGAYSVKGQAFAGFALSPGFTAASPGNFSIDATQGLTSSAALSAPGTLSITADSGSLTLGALTATAGDVRVVAPVGAVKIVSATAGDDILVSGRTGATLGAASLTNAGDAGSADALDDGIAGHRQLLLQSSGGAVVLGAAAPGAVNTVTSAASAADTLISLQAGTDLTVGLFSAAPIASLTAAHGGVSLVIASGNVSLDSIAASGAVSAKTLNGGLTVGSMKGSTVSASAAGGDVDVGSATATGLGGAISVSGSGAATLGAATVTSPPLLGSQLVLSAGTGNATLGAAAGATPTAVNVYQTPASLPILNAATLSSAKGGVVINLQSSNASLGALNAPNGSVSLSVQKGDLAFDSLVNSGQRDVTLQAFDQSLGQGQILLPLSFLLSPARNLTVAAQTLTDTLFSLLNLGQVSHSVSIEQTLGDLGSASSTLTSPASISVIADHGSVTYKSLAAGPGGNVTALARGGALSLGSASGADLTLAAAAGGINVTSGLNATQAVSLTTTAGGAINVAGGLQAATLTGSSAGAVSIPTASVATLEGFTSTGGFSLGDAGTLKVTGAVTDTAVTGKAAKLSLTTSGGDLDLQADVSELTAGGAAAGAVTLTAGGALNQTSGAVKSLSATLASKAGMTLAGDLSLDPTAGVATLSSGAGIDESGGSIVAATLTGHAAGATDLRGLATPTGATSRNLIGALGAFTDTAGGFELYDGQALSVAGPVSATTGGLSIATTAGGLTLAGDIAAGAGATTLQAAGALTQTAGTVAGSSIALASGEGMTLGSALSTAGQVTLTSGASLDESAGRITAGSLGGASSGAASLTGANAIATLGGFTSRGGFSLVDGQGLTVAGLVQDTGATGAPASVSIVSTAGALNLGADVQTVGPDGAVAGTVALSGAGSLDQTGGAIRATAARLTGGPGGMRLAGALDLSADPVLGVATLVSGGGVDGSAGSLAAGVLTGSAAGAVNLTGAGDAIGMLGAFTDTAGLLAVSSRGALAVVGPVTDTAGGVSLASTAGVLTLGGDVDAGAAGLDLAGVGDATHAGVIQTGGLLTGVLSATTQGGLALAGANQLGGVGAVTNTGSGDVMINNAVGLEGAGSIANDVGAVDLTVAAGDLSLGSLSAAGATSDVTLSALAPVAGAGGQITVAALTVGRDLVLTGQGFHIGSADAGFADAVKPTFVAATGRNLSLKVTAGDFSADAISPVGGDLRLESVSGSVQVASASAGDDIFMRADAGALTLGAATLTGLKLDGTPVGGFDGVAATDGLNVSDGPNAVDLQGGLRQLGLTASGSVTLGAAPGATPGAANVFSTGGAAASNVYSELVSDTGSVTANLAASAPLGLVLAKLGDVAVDVAGGDAALGDVRANGAVGVSVGGGSLRLGEAEADTGSASVSASGDITFALAAGARPIDETAPGVFALQALSVHAGGSLGSDVGVAAPSFMAGGPGATGAAATGAGGGATLLLAADRGGLTLQDATADAGVTATAGAGGITLDGAVKAGDDIIFSTTGAVSAAGRTLTAGASPGGAGYADNGPAGSSIVIGAGGDLTVGALTANENIDLQSTGGKVSNTGALLARNDITLTGASVDTTGGALTAGRGAFASGQPVAEATSPASISLTSTGGDVTAGALQAESDVVVNASGAVNLTTAVKAGEAIDLTAGGTITAVGDLLAQAAYASVDPAVGQADGRGDTITVTSTGGAIRLANAVADTDISLNAKGDVDFVALSAGRDAKTVGAGALNGRNVTAGRDALLQSGGGPLVLSRADAGRDAGLTGGAGVQVATVLAGVDATVGAAGDIVVSDRVGALGSATLSSTGGSVWAAKVQAGAGSGPAGDAGPVAGLIPPAAYQALADAEASHDASVSAQGDAAVQDIWSTGSTTVASLGGNATAGLDRSGAAPLGEARAGDELSLSALNGRAWLAAATLTPGGVDVAGDGANVRVSGHDAIVGALPADVGADRLTADAAAPTDITSAYHLVLPTSAADPNGAHLLVNASGGLASVRVAAAAGAPSTLTVDRITGGDVFVETVGLGADVLDALSGDDLYVSAYGASAALRGGALTHAADAAGDGFNVAVKATGAGQAATVGADWSLNANGQPIYPVATPGSPTYAVTGLDMAAGAGGPDSFDVVSTGGTAVANLLGDYRLTRLSGAVDALAASGTGSIQAWSVTAGRDAQLFTGAGDISVDGASVGRDLTLSAAREASLRTATLTGAAAAPAAGGYSLLLSGGRNATLGRAAGLSPLASDAAPPVLVIQAPAATTVTVQALGGDAAVDLDGSAQFASVTAGHDVGVRTSGAFSGTTVQAGAGVSIAAGGDLTLQTATAGGALAATSGGALSLAQGEAGGDAVLQAAGPLSVSALTAGGVAGLSSGSGLILGSITSGGTLTLSGNEVGASGVLTSTGGDLSLTASLPVDLASVGAAGDLQIASSGSTTIGSASAGGSAKITSGGALNLGALTAAGAVDVSSSDAASVGTITSGQNLVLGAARNVRATGALTSSGGDVQVTSTGGAANLAAVNASGAFQLATAGAATVGNGVAGGLVDLTSGGPLVVNGLTGGGAVNLVSQDALTAGTLTAARTLTLTAARDVAVTGGLVSQAGDVDVVATGGGATIAAVRAAGSFQAATAGAATLGAGTVGGSAAVNSGGPLSITALTAGGAVNLSVGDAARIGALAAGQTLSLTADRDVSVSGGLSSSASDVDVTSTGGGATLANLAAFGTGQVQTAQSATVSGLAAHEALVKAGGDATLSGLSVADQATFAALGTVTLGSPSAAAGSVGTAAEVRAGDLNVGGGFSALALTVEARYGGVALGTASPGSARTLSLGQGDVDNLSGPGGSRMALAIYAGLRPATDAASAFAGEASSFGDATVGTLGLDSARLSSLSLYAAPSQKVVVTGALAPKDDARSLALQIGDRSDIAWQPGSIEVVNDGQGANAGSLGAGSATAGATRPFGAVTLNAVHDILIGSADFIAAAQSIPADDINLTSNIPAVAPNGSGAALLAADTLTVRAQGKVLQQNTSAAQNSGGGLLLGGAGVTGPLLTIGTTGTSPTSGTPTVVEFFGGFMDGGTAVTNQLTSASDRVLLEVAPSNQYRLNGCVIGVQGNCTPVDNFVIELQPDRLTVVDLLRRAEDQAADDPTVTGAANEEIWRKPE